MKKLAYITIFIFVIIGTENTEAQILKRLVDKVKGTLEQKTEEKANQQINNAIDSLYAFETKKKSKSATDDRDSVINKNQQSKHQDVLNSIMNAEKPTIKDAYIFTTKAVIEITDLKKNKSLLMTQHYGRMAVLNDFVESNTAVITDLENEAIILLDTKRKTAQVQSLTWMDGILDNSNKQRNRSEYLDMKKTGKEKRLNGYLCFEYHISTDDSKIEAWFAPDVVFDYTAYLRGFNKQFNKNNTFAKLADEEIGYMMEMTVIDNRNTLTTKMLVKEVKQISTKISMQNFEIIQLF